MYDHLIFLKFVLLHKIINYVQKNQINIATKCMCKMKKYMYFVSKE